MPQANPYDQRELTDADLQEIEAEQQADREFERVIDGWDVFNELADRARAGGDR